MQDKSEQHAPPAARGHGHGDADHVPGPGSSHQVATPRGSAAIESQIQARVALRAWKTHITIAVHTKKLAIVIATSADAYVAPANTNSPVPAIVDSEVTA